MDPPKKNYHFFKSEKMITAIFFHLVKTNEKCYNSLLLIKNKENDYN
jgi:hypothetical protein